jgi:trigger factor
VKATVEPLEGNKVKLSVEVDEQEFEEAVEAAFRKIAREVRIPGFRPGKAPRRVLEARLGKDVARQQALQDALPDYYADAVREHEVDVIAPPELDITDGADAGPIAFDAVVEVRPTILVPGYGGLRVTIPAPEPSDDDIDAQVERLRSQFGELAAVDRPAGADDFVSIDIAGSQDGEPVEGLTADDYLYQVGSGAIVAEMDEQLQGAEVGDILEFEAPHPAEPDGDPLTFRILLKEVKERVLPDLDDDFAAEASEFDTFAELRADLAHRMSQVKRAQAQAALREGVGEALVELVDIDLPEALVASELQDRINDLAVRLQAQGITIEQWLAGTGRSQEDFIAELRVAADKSAKVDLALRAVAEAEGIEADDDDLEDEYAQVAERLQLDVDAVREQFERAGQTQAIRSDIKKRKALEWLVDTVEVVDDAGDPVDRDRLELVTDLDDLDEADPADDDPAQPDEAEDDE